MRLAPCEKIVFESYCLGEIRGFKRVVLCRLSPFIFVLRKVFIFNSDVSCLFDKNLNLAQLLTWPIRASCLAIMFFL